MRSSERTNTSLSQNRLSTHFQRCAVAATHELWIQIVFSLLSVSADSDSADSDSADRHTTETQSARQRDWTDICTVRQCYSWSRRERLCLRKFTSIRILVSLKFCLFFWFSQRSTNVERYIEITLWIFMFVFLWFYFFRRFHSVHDLRL